MTQTPLFEPYRSPLISAGVSVMAVAAVFAVVGCEDATTALRAVQAQAVAEVRSGDLDKARTTLATLPDQNLAARAQSKMLLGNVELTAARGLMRDYALKQDDLLDRVADAHDVSRRITALATAADAIEAGDPGPVLDQLAGFTAAGRGDGNRVYFIEQLELDGVDVTVNLQSLSALAQSRSQLEGEIARLESDLQQVTARHDAAMAVVADAQQQARLSSAREAIGFWEAARTQSDDAAGLKLRMNNLGVALAARKSDLERLTQRQEIVRRAIDGTDTAVTSLSVRTRQLEEVRAQQQAAIQANMDSARKLLSEGDASLEQLGSTISALGDELTALREQIIERLASAETAFAAAVTDAQAAERSLGRGTGSPEGPAWDQLRLVLSPGRGVIGQAMVDLALADLHRNHALGLASQHKVAVQVNEFTERLPTNLQALGNADAIKDELELALASADRQCVAAIDRLQGVTTPADVAAEASLKRLAALVGRWQVAELAEQLGLTYENARPAGELLAEARTEADSLAAGDVRLPPLPAAVRTTPAPGGQPAVGPNGGTPGAAADAAADADAETASPDEAGVRAAYGVWRHAVLDGELRQVRTMVSVETGGEAVSEAILAYALAARTLVSAVRDKVPDRADEVAGVVLDQPDSIRVVVSGTSASVGPPGAFPQLPMTFSDGSWKIHAVAPQDDASRRLVEVHRQTAELLRQLAADLHNGSLDSQGLTDRLRELVTLKQRGEN